MIDDEKRARIRARCIEVVSTQLDVDVAFIKDSSLFIDDLGADSLAIVEIIMTAEDEFGIAISEEDAEKIRTVGEAVAYIQHRLLTAGR